MPLYLPYYYQIYPLFIGSGALFHVWLAMVYSDQERYDEAMAQIEQVSIYLSCLYLPINEPCLDEVDASIYQPSTYLLTYIPTG